MTPVTHEVNVNGVRLCYLTLGDPSRPPLVMLHGMRDTAQGLMPVADRLRDRYFVVAPDLRGHGASDQPGAYSVADFTYDLHRVADAAGLDRFHLFGHSLGGHIVCRYAALFPERVQTLIMVEGFGPPRRASESAALDRQREQLLANMALTPTQRELPSVEFAAERLRANNPRLDEAEAARLAKSATRIETSGQLVWAFDPRAQQVFLGVSEAENALFRQHVRCPALVVMGELSYEYWAGRSDEPGWDGRFHGDDLPSRLRGFGDLTYHAFPNAGHMVHYDAPRELARVVTEFLEDR